MTSKKQLKNTIQALDQEVSYSFENVKKDVVTLFEAIQTNEENNGRRFALVEKGLKRVLRELTRNHKHGERTGALYPTLAGKVKALAEHAGIEFGVKEREITPTKVTVTKKAAKKASK